MAVTINGERVTVPPGSTVIDAMRAVGDETVRVDPGADGVADEADVPALCYYDRDGDCSDQIGPRSACRTCMVETDEHGLVPSCSYPPSEVGRLSLNGSPVIKSEGKDAIVSAAATSISPTPSRIRRADLGLGDTACHGPCNSGKREPRLAIIGGSRRLALGHVVADFLTKFVPRFVEPVRRFRFPAGDVLMDTVVL